MAMVEMTAEALAGAGQMLEGKGPVQMVNLIRYNAQAKYDEGSALPPCSGREAYFQRYVPAFAHVADKIAPSEPFTPIFLGSVACTIVGSPGEAWDDIAIVEYQSFEALRKIISSPEYETQAAPHRRAALANWRFIAATKLDLPG
jgi:hypothetical protein